MEGLIEMAVVTTVVNAHVHSDLHIAETMCLLMVGDIKIMYLCLQYGVYISGTSSTFWQICLLAFLLS